MFAFVFCVLILFGCLSPSTEKTLALLLAFWQVVWFVVAVMRFPQQIEEQRRLKRINGR